MSDSIYWINSGWNDLSIRRAPLAGGGTADTLYSGAAQGVTMPFGLAIDAAAGRIYWSNRDDDTIRGAPLAGGGTVQTLYSGAAQGVSSPNGIAIHPAAGRIYWANGGDNTIRRAPLAPGGAVETLYAGSVEGVSTPTGVAIDPAAGRIYWASLSDDTIRGAPLAPHGNVTVLYGPQDVSVPWWVAIDPLAARIYWTHWYAFSDGRLRGAPIAGGGKIDTLYDSTSGVSFPGQIAIDPNPAGPGPARLEVAAESQRYTAGGWIGRALNWARELFSSPPTSPGRIYWGNGVTTRGGEAPNPNDNKIRGAPLAGNGTVDTLYSAAPVVGGPVAFPAGIALLRAPIGTVAPTVSWQFVLTKGHFGGPVFGPVHGEQLEQRLACSTGAWAPDLLGSFLYRAPQGFSYQWSRDGTDINGATSAQHQPTAPGNYTCRVTAANAAGSATQTSAALSVPSSMISSP